MPEKAPTDPISAPAPAPDQGAVALTMADASAGGGFALRGFSWLFGLAMLAVVIMATLHFSEEREIVRIARQAHPWWLVVALLLQAGTYLAQGEIWRVVTRAAGRVVSVPEAFRLSLAMLFIDQALPSAGISGMVFVARVLEQRGFARAIVMAALVVDIVSYYGAYILALALALFLTLGQTSLPVLVATLVFVLLSVLISVAILGLTGRRDAAPEWLTRLPLLRRLIVLLAEADARLAHSYPLLLQSILLQFVIVLLDAATVWALIRSLGETASAAGVFASFMVANLLRTLSIVPGGLGVFEAASVVALQFAGVSLPVALAATLLFRGLSFWLPMLPGIVFSNALRKSTVPDDRQA